MKFSPKILSRSTENFCFQLGDYSFGFQAQEQDNEMWGGSVSFKYRVEDPRLGRFFSVDPLYTKYPWNSNYAFSENRVIDSREIEGLEKVTVHNESFAPFDWFGGLLCGSYSGDGENRVFGGDPTKCRISATCSFDLSKTATSPPIFTPYGSYSHFKSSCWQVDDRIKFSEAQINSSNSNSGSIWFHYSGGNDAAPSEFSCEIDNRIYFSWKETNDPNCIELFGMTWGDRFPSNETYLTDEAGNKLLLGVSGVGSEDKTMGPYTELCGDNKIQMQDWSFKISFTENNMMKIFDKVVSNNGTEFTLEAWNKMFTSLDPKSHCTGTSSSDAGINTEIEECSE